jgi:DNA-binding protein H-NS
MPRPQNLATLSIEGLTKLRDDINEALRERADDLRKQLARFTRDDAPRGRRRGRPPGRKSALRGRKVSPKYRSKKDPKLTWAGRGQIPRWMRDEMKAGKLKKDAFLIK